MGLAVAWGLDPPPPPPPHPLPLPIPYLRGQFSSLSQSPDPYDMYGIFFSYGQLEFFIARPHVFVLFDSMSW